MRMSSWPGNEAAGRFMTPTTSNLWPLTSIHLPIGIFAVDQRPRHIGADHGHRHVVLIFDVGEETAFLHLGLSASAYDSSVPPSLALYSSLPL